jgi:hypothetical protein
VRAQCGAAEFTYIYIFFFLILYKWNEDLCFIHGPCACIWYVKSNPPPNPKCSNGCIFFFFSVRVYLCTWFHVNICSFIITILLLFVVLVVEIVILLEIIYNFSSSRYINIALFFSLFFCCASIILYALYVFIYTYLSRYFCTVYIILIFFVCVCVCKFNCDIYTLNIV